MSDATSRSGPGGAKPKGALVWDLPTRLFHWLLAAAVIGAWATGEGPRQVHVWCGYAIIVLIVFALVIVLGSASGGGPLIYTLF